MDMTIEEYLEFVRSLLEQAEEDGFELEWFKSKVDLNVKSMLPVRVV